MQQFILLVFAACLLQRRFKLTDPAEPPRKQLSGFDGFRIVGKEPLSCQPGSAVQQCLVISCGGFAHERFERHQRIVGAAILLQCEHLGESVGNNAIG